jgi:ribonuclease P/MRP protein subunit POP5
MRIKNRYLLFEISMDDPIDLQSNKIQSIIRDSIEQNFGTLGLSQCQLTIKYYSPFTKLGILKVSRDFYTRVWQAMTFVSKINQNQAYIKVIHTSGTIKKLQKRAIDYNRSILDDYITQQKITAEQKTDFNVSFETQIQNLPY